MNNYFIKNLDDFGLAAYGEEQAKHLRNVQIMDEASESAAKIHSYLQLMNDILDSQKTVDPRRILKHTHGFPNGIEDLLSVQDAFSDNWLNEFFDTESMKKSLAPIQSFLEFAKKLTDEFEGFRNHTPIQNIYRFVKSLANSDSISTNIEKVTIDGCKCFPAVYKFADRNEIDLIQFLREVKRLDVKMDNIKLQLHAAGSYFKKREIIVIMEEMRRIAKKGNTSDTIVLKSAVEEFLETTKWERWQKMLKGYHAIILDEKLLDIQKHVENVRALLPQIDIFKVEWDKLEPLFGCLKLFDYKQLETVCELIWLSREIRSSFMDTLEAEAENVIKYSEFLQKIKNVSLIIDKMRETRNDESDALNVFENVEEYSGIIGTATRGVVNMRDVMNLENSFDVIRRNLFGVGKAAKTFGGISNLEINKLKELEKFEKFLEPLKVWKRDSEDFRYTEFEEYFRVFHYAKSSAKYDDVTDYSEILGKLMESVTDRKILGEVEQLKKALDDLDTVGLDFELYQKSFDDAREAMKALNQYFVRYTQTLHPTTPSPPIQGFTQAELETTTSDLFQNILAISLGVAAIGAIVGSVTLMMCWANDCFCFKKNKQENS